MADNPHSEFEEPSSESRGHREPPRSSNSSEEEVKSNTPDGTRPSRVRVRSRGRELHQRERQEQAEFWQRIHSLTPQGWATQALIGINGLVFAAMAFDGVSVFQPSPSDLVDWGGNLSELTTNDQWWRLLTCTFVHGGIVHLGFNMWVLSAIGRFYERIVGQVGFLLLYLISGVTGSLISILWQQDVVSVGASGAVFGIIGGLGALVIRKSAGFPASVLKPLQKSVVAFLGYNMVIGFALPNIDVAGHLGGLVGGVLSGLVLAQPLDELARRRRPARNIALGLGGGFVLALAILGFPRSADVQGALERLAEVEKVVLPLVDHAAQQYDAGTLSAADFATQLENQALIPWGEFIDEFERLEDVAEHRQELVRLVLEYIRRRHEHWAAMVNALQDPEPDLAIPEVAPLQKRVYDAAEAITQYYQSLNAR